MKFQILLAVIFTIIMCAESTDNQYIEGSYIVMLKDGSTVADLDDVIEKIEKHTSSTREEMEIESDNSITSMIFGKFSEETAKMVSISECVYLFPNCRLTIGAVGYADSESVAAPYQNERLG